MFQSLIFYVVSDDPQWCKANVIPLGEDIYFAGHENTSPDGQKSISAVKNFKVFSIKLMVFLISYKFSIGIDMVLLGLANHTILTYGTFGQWGTIFSGGQAVWPKSHQDLKESLEITNSKMKGWTFI